MEQYSVDLIEDGVLWMINRTIFNPKGYALAIDHDTGQYFIIGDGKESMRFEDDVESDKFRAFTKLMKNVEG